MTTDLVPNTGFYAQINGIFKSLSPMYFRKYFGIVRRHRCAENVSFLGFANDSDISRQPKGGSIAPPGKRWNNKAR